MGAPVLTPRTGRDEQPPVAAAAAVSAGWPLQERAGPLYARTCVRVHASSRRVRFGDAREDAAQELVRSWCQFQGRERKMRRPGRSWDGGGGDAMEVKIETAWQKRRRREVKMHETLTRFGSRAPPSPASTPPSPSSFSPPSLWNPEKRGAPSPPKGRRGLRWSTEEPSQPVVEPPFRSAARCKPPRCAYKRPAFPLAQPARRSCAGPAARRASSAVVHQTNQAPAQAPSSAPARLCPCRSRSA
ncbi:hypothetical protein ACCO45_011546 [Purpureocillium lilacinum]|uniref:Uncharacterized protein n=1 Tax=Purpureocillium lilacinum TaxID=33203 RepID=A0ACC4DB43_PURLI